MIFYSAGVGEVNGILPGGVSDERPMESGAPGPGSPTRQPRRRAGRSARRAVRQALRDGADLGGGPGDEGAGLLQRAELALHAAHAALDDGTGVAHALALGGVAAGDVGDHGLRESGGDELGR